MEQEIILEIIKYGGSTITIYLIILLIKALSELISKKNNNNITKDIEDLKKKVDNEYFHELADIRNEINELWKEVREHGKSIAALEVKIKEIKK